MAKFKLALSEAYCEGLNRFVSRAQGPEVASLALYTYGVLQILRGMVQTLSSVQGRADFTTNYNFIRNSQGIISNTRRNNDQFVAECCDYSYWKLGALLLEAEMALEAVWTDWSLCIPTTGRSST